MPKATLVSGNTYYLYNVEADLFLGFDGGSREIMGVNENALPIEITLLDNGAYTMRITSLANGYIHSNNTYCETNYSWYDANSLQSYWSIAEAEGSFLIQCSSLNYYDYNKDQYLGWQGGNDSHVWTNRPITDGIHWNLIPADGTGNRYMAALKLYKALEMSDAFVGNGWNIDYYNDLYAARETADAEEMTNAAYGLRNGLNMSQGYKAPYWNEYPILWQCSEGKYGDSSSETWKLSDNYNTSETYFQRSFYNPGESTLSATVKVDEPSTFIYGLDGSTSDVTVTVYVDGIKTRELKNEQINKGTSALGKYTYTKFFETLETGTHTIKWVLKQPSHSYNGYYQDYYIRNAGVMKSPLITVNLLEPGSLGTEVLYNTDHIKNVRRLKVRGKMNNDDWSKIKMMHFLQDLDLSEAEFTEIPESQFSCEADTSSFFLHKMRLPEGLVKINEKAFYYSFLDHLEIPSTVKTVGYSAFSCSHIQELILPDDLTELLRGGSYNDDFNTFSYMYWLKHLVCPNNLTVIPRDAFLYNLYCEDVTLPKELTEIGPSAFRYNKNIKTTFPDKLKTIEGSAFSNCTNAQFSDLPQSLESIGNSAFEGCNGLTNVVIPNNVSSIGFSAYRNCKSLTSAEVSVAVYDLEWNIFSGCNNLKVLRLNCPTVVSYYKDYSGYYPVDANMIKDVTLIVPNHIVTSYKLDNYWYNFKSIEGFSTAEIQDWTINRPLVLNRDRFEGTPNITINGDKDRLPSLKINGDAAMTINNLTFGGSYSNYYYNYPGQILSQCNNISIIGDVQTALWSYGKSWYFYALPFDIKVSEITHSAANVQKSVRYYDGANRATVGASGSWKNYEADAIIPAGTGFIMQTNVSTYNYFHALDNESKQQCVSYKEFVKTLDVNDSQNPSNKGWNLVGNPWQCYYNDHALNFTAPITVWNVDNRTYTAYSITDDDYAIRPNEAFFVQCPSEEYNTIGFPTQGRQLTPIIESQNAVRSKIGSANNRQIVNITISNGEMEDQTRVVLNEEASMEYETACDASKFLSMDGSVPQIFTTNSDGTMYAINERPMADGTVQLGFYAGKAGKYTIAVGRCDAEKVLLTDELAGTTTELTAGEYTFSADAGTYLSRFSLSFMSDVTAIDTVESDNKQTKSQVYSVDGKFVGSNTNNLNTGVYIVRKGNKVNKIVVR